MNLSDENVHLCTLPADKAEKLFHDDTLPGFGIRVRRDADGRTRRRWFYQYRSKLDGTQRRIALGNVDRPAAVPAAKARQAATEIAVKVQLGQDPQGERKAGRKSAKRLFGDEAQRYLEDRLAGITGRRPMKLSTYKAGKRYFELHWGAFQKRPVDSITDNDVREQLRQIIERHGKVAAARAKTFLSAFYVWAIREGSAKANPTIGTHAINENPPRDRVLSDDEIKAVWSACLDNDFGRIVKLLLFTACRRDEIGGLVRAEFNSDSGLLTITGARTKSGRPLILTLPPVAADILRGTPQRAGREFFFGLSGGAFSRWSWEKLALDGRLAQAGYRLERWTLHDLRRTVRTGMGKIGIKPHIAELVLNHVGHKSGIGAVYDTHDYMAEIAEALASWSRHLMAIVGEPDSSNVTPLRRTA
jgi:integrase